MNDLPKLQFRLTLAQAMQLADAFNVEPETVASNGAKGMVVFSVSGRPVEAIAFAITVATALLISDDQSITVTEDQTEEGDLRVVNVTIHTEN